MRKRCSCPSSSACGHGRPLLPSLPRKLRLVLLALLSTGAARAQPEPVAVLSGHVAPSQADSVLVNWRTTPFDEHEHAVGVAPDSRGHFELRVPVSAPVLALLSAGSHDTPLFLEPGDALHVQLQGEGDDAAFRFQPADGPAHAPAAIANNYLVAFDHRFVEDLAFQVLPDNIKLPERGFVSFLDYRQKQELKMLQSELGPAKVTPAFWAFAQAEIACATANDRLTYPGFRAETLGIPPVPASPDFFDFLADPVLLSSLPGACLSPQYQDFALNYVQHLVKQSGKTAADVCYYPACYQEAGRRLQGPMRTMVQGQVVLQTIRNGHVAHADALLADYATHGAPAAWVAQLRSQQEAHRRLAIGSPAPPLPEGLRSLRGDTLRLRAGAGKLVYLLLWEPRKPASLREIRPLKELMARLANQPIEWVALALDDQPDAWRRVVATSPPLPGEQALLPSAAAAALRQAYDVTALPAAVLLAEDGTILQLNARRPSSELLRNDLEAAVGRAVAYRAVQLP